MTKSSTYDALSSLAPLLRVRPELEDVCRFGGGWESSHDAGQPGWAYFHVIVRGECLIDRPSRATMRLKAGDILLLPHGSAHLARGRVSAGQASPPIAIDYRDGIRTKTSMGVSVTTELICGRLHFEKASEGLLLAALPEVSLSVWETGQLWIGFAHSCTGFARRWMAQVRARWPSPLTSPARCSC
jgi:AraC family transcriptional regulator, activator of mtrCDE